MVTVMLIIDDRFKNDEIFFVVKIS